MTTFKAWVARSANHLAGLALALLLPMSAAAEGEVEMQPVNTVSASGFDWLASNGNLSQEEAIAQLRVRQLAASRTMGVGSWVCSPAGFGRTSRCTRN